MLVPRSGNSIRNNLVVGTLQIYLGKTVAQRKIPWHGTFEIFSAANFITGNVAGGSDMMVGGRREARMEPLISTSPPSPPTQLDAIITMPQSKSNSVFGLIAQGFKYFGVPCSSNFTDGEFENNWSHSALQGIWIRASSASDASGCTALRNFTTYLNWDWGVSTIYGLTTDLILKQVRRRT